MNCEIMTVQVCLLTNMYSTAAKFLALTACTFTSLIALFVPVNVLSVLMYTNRTFGIVTNAALFALSLIGWIDLIWHDILKRGFIVPRLDKHMRHHLCVGYYSSLSGIFAVRAFVAAGATPSASVLMGSYYLSIAVGIAIIAVALAQEHRE